MANPDHVGGFPKPSSLARKVAQHGRTLARQRARAARAKTERQRQQAIRRVVFTRDQGVSRFSGTPLRWQDANPLLIGHAHHIKFRSQGGEDQPFNLVLLSPLEHEMAHGRHPTYVLDISGDANLTLVFTTREIETGKVADVRVSPNPSAGERLRRASTASPKG